MRHIPRGTSSLDTRQKARCAEKHAPTKFSSILPRAPLTRMLVNKTPPSLSPRVLGSILSWDPTTNSNCMARGILSLSAVLRLKMLTCFLLRIRHLLSILTPSAASKVGRTHFLDLNFKNNVTSGQGWAQRPRDFSPVSSNKVYLVRYTTLNHSCDRLTPRGPALFSLYLTPKAVGNAELTIGGIDHTKFQGTKDSRCFLLILEANELRRQPCLCILTLERR